MLTFTYHSIFESPSQTLVNPVNCMGTMGKGLAFEFSKHYPEIINPYRIACAAGTLKPGILQIVDLDNGKKIINFPTKLHWRTKSKVEYVEGGLDVFRDNYEQWGITSVSFPQLGCGLGGLSWEIEILRLMRKYLLGLPIPIIIHKVKK